MIYIDISDTIKLPYITGIQRVVRSIVKYTIDNEVVTFVEFDRIAKHYLIIEKNDYRLLLLSEYRPTSYSIYSKKFWYRHLKGLLSKQFKIIIIKILTNVHLFSKVKFKKIIFLFNTKILKNPSRITMKSSYSFGDTLFIADSSWNYQPWIEVKKAKAKGLKVEMVVYDILPVIYPNYFEKITINNFNLWFKMVIYYCDEVHAISKTTANNICKEIPNNILNHNKIKVMKLGSDIDINLDKHVPPMSFSNDLDNMKRLVPQGSFDLKIKQSFHLKLHKIRFLTVGTIEPRKNHNFLLKVFDLLWRAGHHDIEWHIVGKEGWHSKEFIKLVLFHPKLNTNLFFHGGISDVALSKLYLKSQCVLVPSIDEGYGLQIAEGLQNNCDVLVSDIEIFREFNLSENSYFSIKDNGVDLQSKLFKYINGTLKTSQTENNNIFSWEDAVRKLMLSLENT
ncbi:glycosyltransferase [Candidatus Pseudothioglobus sp. Uisw_086]|uniref:glycosyltransferase n=1 Tax=Candidatus Pseudothioglobus sp. Uisw_086 TaxID=3230998 RepID=UPI003A8C6090